MKCYPVSDNATKKFTAYLSAKYDIDHVTPMLFGIRDESNVNTFNDVVGIHYFEKNKSKILVTIGTTDPGLPWILKPMLPGGAAILATGFHKNLWRLGIREKLGPHRDITVFRQDGSTGTIYRDKNKDGKVQMGEPRQSGNFEIQFHVMAGNNGAPAKVGLWSAGCQGPNDLEAFTQIVKIAQDFDDATGRRNRFSYLLMGKISDSSHYPPEFLKPLEKIKRN